MDSLLTPASVRASKSSNNEVSPSQPVFRLDTFSPDNVVEVLKAEPGYDTLVSVLRTLVHEQDKDGGFNIGTPGPQAAKIVHVLVNEVVPNYWPLFRESSEKEEQFDIELLLGLVRNLAGLNAILLRISTLSQECAKASENKRSGTVMALGITLDLLCEVLRGDDCVQQLWTTTVSASDATNRRIVSRELINTLGSGKIISLSAEAERMIPQESKNGPVWTAIGMEYSTWLARNVIAWAKRGLVVEDKKLTAELIAKSLRLGYMGKTISYPLIVFI